MASGDGTQSPGVDDPPAPSSNGSVPGMILGGLCCVVVGIFKAVWFLLKVVFVVWGFICLMNWLSDRSDR